LGNWTTWQYFLPSNTSCIPFASNVTYVENKDLYNLTYNYPDEESCTRKGLHGLGWYLLHYNNNGSTTNDTYTIFLSSDHGSAMHAIWWHKN